MSAITAAHIGSNKGIEKHKGKGTKFDRLKEGKEKMKAKIAEKASANLPMHGDERHNPTDVPADAQAQAVDESPAEAPNDRAPSAFKMKGFSGFGNEK